MAPNPKETELSFETPAGFLAYLEKYRGLPLLNAAGFARLENAMINEDVLATYTLIENLGDEDHAKRDSILAQWYPRPKKLFHSSPHEDLKIVEPVQGKIRHSNEPPQIFTSPSEQIASLFLNDIENMTAGSYDNGVTWELVIGDEARFREHDTGGYLYELPPNTFSTKPDHGLGLFEWQSIAHVESIAKKFYPSALDAMLSYDIRVYFLIPEEYKEFENAHNQKEILDHKKPYQKNN